MAMRTKTVCAELQQDGGQDDRALRGCLRVCVGQPGVEREHRHFDRKAEEHAGEDPDLDVAIDRRRRGGVVDQVHEAEALAAGLEEECEEGNEHERRAEHRVEEELERGVLALLAAPDADHEVHGQEHDFEEDEEQDQVLGDERAGHTGLQHEHQDVERLGIARVGHVVPRVDHDEERDAHRQEVQRQADAVETDGVARLDDRNPLSVDSELQRAPTIWMAVVEQHQGDDADNQRCASGDDADALDTGLVVLGPEHHDEHADERQEGAQREDEVVVKIH